jgi:hypothetical protein
VASVFKFSNMSVLHREKNEDENLIAIKSHDGLIKLQTSMLLLFVLRCNSRSRVLTVKQKSVCFHFVVSCQVDVKQCNIIQYFI